MWVRLRPGPAFNKENGGRDVVALNPEVEKEELTLLGDQSECARE
jgi:hypothetical protein